MFIVVFTGRFGNFLGDHIPLFQLTSVSNAKNLFSFLSQFSFCNFPHIVKTHH